MNKKQFFAMLLLNLVLIFGTSFFVYFKLSQKPTKNELISEFYATENAVYVSPHSIRKAMDKGEVAYTIVDLRSKEEYDKEHVVGAINIPAYSDPDTSAYGEVDRIVSEFKKLPTEKEIVVYCYSIPCMTGRKIGQMLAEHGIFVKHLGIGWNEWRYYWNLWNHEHEWEQTDVENYIQKGSEPGKSKVKVGGSETPCSLDNTFGC